MQWKRKKEWSKISTKTTIITKCIYIIHTYAVTTHWNFSKDKTYAYATSVCLASSVSSNTITCIWIFFGFLAVYLLPFLSSHVILSLIYHLHTHTRVYSIYIHSNRYNSEYSSGHMKSHKAVHVIFFFFVGPNLPFEIEVLIKRCTPLSYELHEEWRNFCTEKNNKSLIVPEHGHYSSKTGLFMNICSDDDT